MMSVWAMLFFNVSAARASTVENNISVTSSSGGGGQSSVSVETTLNGKLVEDYEKTTEGGDISYTSTATEDGVVSSSSINTTTNSATSTSIERLRELVALLTSLVEKLMNALSQS